MNDQSRTDFPDFDSPQARFRAAEAQHWQPAQAQPIPAVGATPTQASLSGNPFRTYPSASTATASDNYAPYGQAQAFQATTVKPKRKTSRLAGVVAVAMLAAGIGGASGIAVDRYYAGESAGSVVTTAAGAPASSSTVVQADADNPDWAATAAAVVDAVVAIEVTGQSGTAQGSGVILDGDGNIVTNNHVVSSLGTDARITVVIDNVTYEASVVGTDPSTDLAVIKLVDPPSDLTTIEFADSSTLTVGQQVMAIGNPLGLSDTVTTGIVSALDRPVTTEAVDSETTQQQQWDPRYQTNNATSTSSTVVTAAIQTNAAINPGNSGGALVDASGRLIGITSSIATLTSGSSSSESGNIGIGFAIGSNQVKYIVDQLIATGTAQHAQLGISASDSTSSSQLGAEVSQITSGSASEAAGVQVGDLITAIDGKAVDSSETLVALIRASEVGQQVTLTVLRNGEEKTLTATLQAAAS